MRLLVLRPEPGASATAERIAAAGHEADLMSAFRLAPVAWKAPDPSHFDGLLLTSGNAVRLSGPALASFATLPVYAVGEATARAAVKAELNLKATGTAGVAALLAMAESQGNRRLLWLAGRDRIDIEPASGMSVEIAPVYESEALPAPSDFADRVAQADAVLLHSPRAAAHFGWLCDDAAIARQSVALAALSQAIADVAGTGWADVAIADIPTDASLLFAIESRLKHTS